MSTAFAVGIGAMWGPVVGAVRNGMVWIGMMCGVILCDAVSRCVVIGCVMMYRVVLCGAML